MKVWGGKVKTVMGRRRHSKGRERTKRREKVGKLEERREGKLEGGLDFDICPGALST